MQRLHDACAIGIVRRGQREPRRQHARGIESRVDALQRERAANEEPRADEQQQRDRQLRDDEASAETVADAAHACAASTGLDHRLDVDARRPKRRRDAKEHRAHERDHQREEQHIRIERRLLEPGYARGSGSHQRPDPPGREADADDGRDEGEDDAFGQELPGDPRPARAEGCPHGELAGARGPACQQQVGDVAAGDEQDEADGAEKREHAPRVVADEIVERGDGREVELGRFAREGAAETLGVGAQLAERLLVGRPGLQARVDLQVVLVVHGLAFRRERDRHPQFFAVGGVGERRRHDADDVVGASVERDAASDGSGIAAEAPRPEPVAEHGDLLASGLIFLRREHAAVRRRQVEDVEVPGRDAPADQPLGVVAVGQVEARELLGGDRAERT